MDCNVKVSGGLECPGSAGGLVVLMTLVVREKHAGGTSAHGDGCGKGEPGNDSVIGLHGPNSDK